MEQSAASIEIIVTLTIMTKYEGTRWVPKVV